MVEFNADGSIKLPDNLTKQKKEREFRMQKGNCITIKKQKISFTSPKKCLLDITLSDSVSDNRFMETIYNNFSNDCATPTKITKISEKKFQIELGSDFKRCSECTILIQRFKNFLYDNVIEDNGNCTYELPNRNQNFTEEDYFE